MQIKHENEFNTIVLGNHSINCNINVAVIEINGNLSTFIQLLIVLIKVKLKPKQQKMKFFCLYVMTEFFAILTNSH